jgi:inward rectifier potassium channel
MIKKLKNKLDEDLGFGSQVIQENKLRFINKDGSLNVRKKHASFGPNSSLYHAVINTTWPRFFMVVVVIYFATNSIFTLLYLTAGTEAFPTIANLNVFSRAEELFFYSIQILTTLGSSPIQPKNLMSHILLSMEAMIGMIGFSLGAGLIFARFSHPSM